MGLDMYLYANKYLSKWGRKGEEEKAKELRAMFNVPPCGNLESVELKFEVGYWRKANQIHKWFIDNCADGNDDCRSVYVSREKLQELLCNVDEILKSTKLVGAKVVNGYNITDKGREPIIEDGQVMEDFSTAERILPPSEGFFFGGTGYDQWYWEDLTHTKKILEKILNDKNLDDFEFAYKASW